MSLLNAVVLAVLTGILVAAGIRFWQDRGDEAALRADLQSVRSLARDYARWFCDTSTTPPADPESITDAARRIGAESPSVLDPGRWSLRVSQGTDVAGYRAWLHYDSDGDGIARGVLQTQAGATRTGSTIEIPLTRSVEGNRAGFRWLMSDSPC